MYKEPKNKALVSRARRECTSIAKEVERILRVEYKIPCQVSLVGSGKRKMILLNGKDKHIDFDFNMFIYNGFKYNPVELRRIVRLVFNRVLNERGLRDVADSTTSLTTKMMYFPDDPLETMFHIDLAIVTIENGCLQRMKYNKKQNSVIWNKSANLKTFSKKEKAVHKTCSQMILQTYIEKKNLHINDEKNHPSFNCYIEAINQLYNSKCR